MEILDSMQSQHRFPHNIPSQDPHLSRVLAPISDTYEMKISDMKNDHSAKFVQNPGEVIREFAKCLCRSGVSRVRSSCFHLTSREANSFTPSVQIVAWRGRRRMTVELIPSIPNELTMPYSKFPRSRGDWVTSCLRSH